ncbi:MAG TPA: D-tagatose-bisphosphate aldolase, class II, non-catalytic subunit [Dongiaceae bacterium]
MSLQGLEGRAPALTQLTGQRTSPQPRGIASICSAHPLVLEAALRRGKLEGAPVLIEATCNQVNQEGGYTGMVPADFRRFVESIAAGIGFPSDRLILGGDHLGPNPWKRLPAEEAMARAEAMVAAYVDAGFRKIHLDTSVGCAGEPVAVADELSAARAASLARIAEDRAAMTEHPPPLYIVGTEVPPPGGAAHLVEELAVTEPAAAEHTLAAHGAAFAAAGVVSAFRRVIGIVVQPGVEFGNAKVAIYRPELARGLSTALGRLPGLVFEAHSTDYQPAGMLAALVDDGFAILKVGPGLTFALREALYGLDAIAVELAAITPEESLERTMERVMLDNPAHWRSHYPGSPEEQRLLRHFSYSDRIRYYWPDSRAAAAVERLIDRLGASAIPETLISQHLARLHSSVLAGEIPPKPRALCLAAVNMALDPYYAATRGAPSSAASPP